MPPFKLLVVEDITPTLDQLVGLLEDEFPDAEVDVAQSVAEAAALLARTQGQGYDAALLDFRLPKSPGEEEVIDSSLCNEISRAHPGTLVMHITSFIEDPEVVRHLAESHGEPSQPWPFFLDKNDVHWPTLLVKRLKMFLYGREIAAQLDELFGPQPSPSASRLFAYRRPAAREGAVTQRLASVTQDIEQHWPHLSGALRERIAANFVVEPVSEDEVRVGLL